MQTVIDGMRKTERGIRMARRKIQAWMFPAAFLVPAVLAGGIYYLLNRDVRPAEPVQTPESAQEQTKEDETAEQPEEVKEEVYTASLFATGDALIHGSIWLDAATDNGYDFSNQLEVIGEMAEPYDLAYYNQETIIGGDDRGPHGYPTFNTPSAYADQMVEYGFNIVSTANNHCLDQGPSGIENSINYWKSKENVVNSGTFISEEDQKSLNIHEVNGISYAFFSWTYGMNGLEAPYDRPWMVNCYENRVEEMLEQVRQADQQADVVIVAMHWGTEYYMGANDEQKDLARRLSEAGCDIIIGNHPHVIQPVEWVNDHKTICFYAMGNMISAQWGEENRVGVVAGMNIVKKVKGEEVTVSVEDVRADLIWTSYRKISDAQVDQVKLYRFSDLTDDILPGHDEVYRRYLEVLQSLDDSIPIGGV